MVRFLRSTASIVNAQTGLTVALSVAATWVCRRFEWFAEFPLTLMGTAVIFPIVFSIGGAYKRRESALDDYGTLKAHGRALFFATRDWLEDTDEELQADIKGRLYVLLDACREMFMSPVEQVDDTERKVYAAFSDLSLFVKVMRSRGLPSGECSRCNQFISKMVVSFEHIKHVYQYRTPQTLRAYSKVFIVVLPVLYGPYFAAVAQDFTPGFAYVMPVLLSVILVSLDNIQEHLENPFDQVGEDDLMINAEKFVTLLQSDRVPVSVERV